MALQDRTELEQLIGTNIATNNSKQITAKDMREVLEALSESKYNIKSDNLKEVKYEGDITLQDKLAGLFREVIKRGSFSGLDIGGHQVSDTLIVDPDDVIVDTATVTGTAKNDTIVRVTFKPEAGDITLKAVIPIFHFTGSNGDASNDVGYPVIKIISSNELHVAMGEFRGQVQSLKVEFILI
jgi:hypothetical protein